MNESGNESGGWFRAVADATFAAVTSDGVERLIDRDSQLAQEISECTDDTSAHFLGELPRHCMMLVIAAADACTGLSGSGRKVRSVLLSWSAVCLRLWPIFTG